MVINAWSSSDEGGSFVENTVTSQTRIMEEQWWVDVIAPGSLLIPSSLSQQESNVQSADVDIGVPSGHVEDLENILLTQRTDLTIMKWLMGDGQTYGQGATQFDQVSTSIDTVMFGQDSWSPNQHQSNYPLGDNMLTEFILHDYTVGNTYSSPFKPCISLSPSSPPISEFKSLHTSYPSPPRSQSPPSSYLQGISINLPNRSQVFDHSAILPATAIMEETRSHSLSDPSSIVGTLSLSPKVSTAGEYYAQNDLLGNSIVEAEFSHENTYAVHQTGSVMEDGLFAMEDNLSSSPSVHASHLNLPSLTPAYYHQEYDEEFGEGRLLQRSFSSLVPRDPIHQQIFPPVMPRCCLLQRQRSWDTRRSSTQLLQFGPVNSRSPAADDWKPESSRMFINGALSPISSDSGFYPRSFQAGSSFQQSRSQRKPQDVNFDTWQMDAGTISEGGLAIVNLLLRAAEAVDIGNAEMAKVILARLNQHISPTREKSIHRVAHYFRQALVTRLVGVDNFAVQFSRNQTLTPIEEFHKINAYIRFCEVSPYPKFAHFTANQAILEALAGEEAMHVIDFQMGAGAQWASFLQDIASLRAAGKLVPTVRLTAVGTRADEIRATGANLCHFARMVNVSLEFQAVVTRPECLDVSMLRLRAHEAVAGNFIFSLHELLDEGASNGLSTVLKSVLDARPKVVTVVEQEANHSGPFFQQRFSEALQYYMSLFDSLTSSLGGDADSSVNSSIESYILAPEIMNIVAYDGMERVERHERLEQWRERMLAAGFRPRSLSDASKFQAEKLVTQISARQGFVVNHDRGSLLLGWQGRPLMAASSWIC